MQPVMHDEREYGEGEKEEADKVTQTEAGQGQTNNFEGISGLVYQVLSLPVTVGGYIYDMLLSPVSDQEPSKSPSNKDATLTPSQVISPTNNAVYIDSQVISPISNVTDVVSPEEPGIPGIMKKIKIKGRSDSTFSNTDILTPLIAAEIQSLLPPLLRFSYTWKLIYSPSQHGTSFHTLLNKTKGPNVIAVRDEDGYIFGCFVTDAWKTRKGHYGTGECFLWSFRDGAFHAYKASGKNDYYMFTDPRFIALGCSDGKFGFYLDDSLLSGSSQPCATFQNDQLSAKPDFNISALEVWEVADL